MNISDYLKSTIGIFTFVFTISICVIISPSHSHQLPICKASTIQYSFENEVSKPKSDSFLVAFEPEAAECGQLIDGIELVAIKRIVVSYIDREMIIPEKCITGLTTGIVNVAARHDEFGFRILIHTLEQHDTSAARLRDIQYFDEQYVCTDD
ncbi:MAG: hypothetical protein AAFW81_05920 [Pseudomonadota bacterium]